MNNCVCQKSWSRYRNTTQSCNFFLGSFASLSLSVQVYILESSIGCHNTLSRCRELESPHHRRVKKPPLLHPANHTGSFKSVVRITNRNISASGIARDKFETSICSIFSAVLLLFLHFPLALTFPCRFHFRIIKCHSCKSMV